jgi:molecular chaperone GrpE (heat shock protein)
LKSLNGTEENNRRVPKMNGEELESADEYAESYANLGREEWDGEEDDDSEERERIFDDYFAEKPGHYIHHMIDRIEELKKSVRAAAADVRDRDSIIGNLVLAILNASEHTSKISASVHENGTADGKAIMRSVEQIDTNLAKALETTGLADLESIGDALDPSTHRAVGDNKTVPPGTVGKVEDEVIYHVKAVVTRTPAPLEPEP